jgi:hypothetical protein
MRTDPAAFSASNLADSKEPRFVVRIGYDLDSLAITSHSDTADVTAGTVLLGMLAEPTVTSQRLKPDDAVAEIGSASFSLIDGDSEFSEEVRERLVGGEGLRGKKVEFYVGFAGLAFSDFQLVATQLISTVKYSDGRYDISCLDIQRQLRNDIFEPVSTTISAAVLEGDTSITLTSITGLQLVPHTAAASDAPNALVGYVKIRNEIIRYTGFAGTMITGCTRGVFGTTPAAYPVDPAVAAERREKVTEYIYLELPAVKLALAILSGFVAGNMLAALGGFETDSNADGLSDFWQNYSNTTTYTRVAGRTGGFAQRFLASGGSTPRLTMSFGQTIKPGRQFTVSAWMRVALGQTVFVSAKGFTSSGGGETVSFSNIVTASTGGWQRVSATFTSSAAGPFVRPIIGLGGTPAAATVADVDDVQIELGGTLTDYTTSLGNALPDHWGLGIPESFLRQTDFRAIGPDLWDTTSDAAGLILRFAGLTKTDGKRFLEKEIYLACGLYSPVYADGRLGLRRMIRLREAAGTVLTLDESNSVQVGDLQHDMRGMHNVFIVEWSYNGTEFRRANSFVDAASAAKHGEAETLRLSFKGLHGSRHTDAVIFGMLDMLRDRYAGPPLRLSVSVLHSLNRIEVGDVVHVRYANVRDFTTPAGSVALNRAFEVQNVSVNHRIGAVELELFASTAEPSIDAPTPAIVTSLPDAFYTSQGTALSAVPGMVIGSDIMTAAPVAGITGNASLTAGGAIFYHNSNLTIAAGVNLKIGGNIQLRIKGFLQVNGTITGTGGGKAGVVDDGRALIVSSVFPIFPTYVEPFPGTPGYVGSVRGSDGIVEMRNLGGAFNWYNTWSATPVPSLFPSAPRLLLSVVGNVLNGLPDDIRGAGGAPGGRIATYISGLSPEPGFHLGGTGGSGGAGLVIVCRGMALGINGQITLSGNNTTSPGSTTVDGYVRWRGVGAPGGPGTMMILLDGGQLSIPDLGAKYISKVGTATVTGNPLPKLSFNQRADVTSPITGFADPQFLTTNAQDFSSAALLIQHIPGVQVVEGDQDELVPPLTGLSTESAEQAINVTVTAPTGIDSTEMWMSSTNNRTNATRVFDGLATVIPVRVPDGVTRYFWGRNRIESRRSEWFPVSSTGGIVGSSVGGLICRGFCEAFGTGVRKNGGTAAFDSDAYSPESYAGGIFVNWQCDQTTALLIIGLNADPETDTTFSGLDYAWSCRQDGILEAREAGVGVGNFGSYTTTTMVGLSYDGQVLRYLKDGVVQRAVQVTGLTLFVDSAFSTPGGSVRNLKYGPVATGPAVPWIARNRCVCTPTTISKVGGSAAYDSDCYSSKLYENGCMLSFQPSQTDKAIAVGLNSDPTTDQNFTGIDYCWVAFNDGVARIWESGVNISANGAYTANTVFGMKYDGQQVQYLLDGVVVRTVPVRNATFFFDSSFRDPGGTIRNVEFGPLTTAASMPFVARGNCVATFNTIRKVGGAAAFDSDAYSSQAYDACVATAQCSSGSGSGNAIVFGLNADPLTDQTATSIDYGFSFNATTLTCVINNASATTAAATYAATDVASIKYDGETVRWYVNGVEVRAVADPGKRFFFDSSFSNPGGSLYNVEFTPATNSPAVPFTVTGNCIAGTSTIKKVGGSAAWDSQAYSVASFENGCQLTFQMANITSTVVMGLNTDPTTNASFTSIDYAFGITNSGYVFYESNVIVGSTVTFAVGSTFMIRHDGEQIQYFVNGILVRTVPDIRNRTFFFDSSFNTLNSECKNVQFSATTQVPSSPWITRGTAVATVATARKIGATTAWDSDVYSTAAYRGGCVLSCIPDTTTAALMVGLEDNPAAGTDFSHLDHAFYVRETGTDLEIWEAGVVVLDLGPGSYDTTTSLAIVYDGSVVRYVKNGVVIRERYSPGKTFYGRVALRDPGARVRALSFSGLNSSTPVPFIARTTTMQVSDTAAYKVSGSNAWDADCISIVGYPVCHIQFKPGQSNAHIVVGLNSDPYTDSSYTSIDAGWYCQADGQLSVYESGTLTTGFGAYTSNTLLGVTYDGTNARYYKNNQLVRTTAMAATNMFMDSSFFTVGASANSFRFGPGTILPLVDTADIQENAVGYRYQFTQTSVVNGFVNPSGAVPSFPVCSFTIPNVPLGALVVTTACIEYKMNTTAISPPTNVGFQLIHTLCTAVAAYTFNSETPSYQPATIRSTAQKAFSDGNVDILLRFAGATHDQTFSTRVIMIDVDVIRR